MAFPLKEGRRTRQGKVKGTHNQLSNKEDAQERGGGTMSRGSQYKREWDRKRGWVVEESCCI